MTINDFKKHSNFFEIQIIFIILQKQNQINIVTHKKMSYYRHIYHIVFRTYKNDYAINEEHEKELYSFIWGYCQNNGHYLHRIGGMPDHLHILVELKPDISVSDFVQVVKQSSSRMLKNNPNFPLFRGWQKSFGSFSYCKSELETVKRYIMNQKKHHKQKTFIEEMKNLFDENRILYDEYIENNI